MEWTVLIDKWIAYFFLDKPHCRKSARGFFILNDWKIVRSTAWLLKQERWVWV